MSWNAFVRASAVCAALALTACASRPPSSESPAETVDTPVSGMSASGPEPQPAPIRIGLALGGGAAKGFAHIGVIKALEAHGLEPDVVAGTSAGSVVGALYASGLNAAALQDKAVTLNEASVRDFQLSAAGLVKGRKLQDFINEQVGFQPLEKLTRPFAAVATRLEDGKRTLFTRGNTGQAVRASSSIPGLFESVKIGAYHYVDGGVTSPVPVEAARELGADIVIAVDISDKPQGQAPTGMLGAMNQSLAIMSQRLGQLELAKADVVIAPSVLDISAMDFTQRQRAMEEGEKAALAAMPALRQKIEQLRAQRAARQPSHAPQQLAQKPASAQDCQPRSTWHRLADAAGLGSGSCQP